MRTFLFGGVAAIGLLGSAQAATILEDPLHGFCNNVACSDINSGGNTVTSNATTGFNGTHWGFTISPGPQTGAFDVIVAAPNNEALGGSAITGTINGASVGSVALVSRGGWSSGFLDAVASIAGLFPSASPTNPFGNFIGFTQSVDAGATGYNLYSASFGSRTVQANSNAGPGAMDLSADVPVGSMIFGFFHGDSGWVATASSGVLWDDDAPPPPVPEPATLALFGVGLLGLGFARRRSA